MKLSFIQLLLVAITFQMGLSAPLKAQLLDKRVTVNLTDQNLEKVLKTIAAKANLKLVYNNQVWKSASKVNAVFTNVKVGEVLDKVLQSSDVTYEVINDQFIVLKLKTQKKAVSASVPVSAENTDEKQTASKGFVVSGTVTDEQGEPLPGVTVKVKDAIQAVTTNLKGRYIIGLAKPNSTLEFTFIGYRNQAIVVNKEGTVDVKMIPDPSKLDEVVIIGYGTTTRRTSTGAQGGISATNLHDEALTAFLKDLNSKFK